MKYSVQNRLLVMTGLRLLTLATRRRTILPNNCFCEYVIKCRRFSPWFRSMFPGWWSRGRPVFAPCYWAESHWRWRSRRSPHLPPSGFYHLWRVEYCCTIGLLQCFNINGNQTAKDVLVHCETFAQFIGKVEKREEDFSLLNVLIRVIILQWPGSVFVQAYSIQGMLFSP